MIDAKYCADDAAYRQGAEHHPPLFLEWLVSSDFGCPGDHGGSESWIGDPTASTHRGVNRPVLVNVEALMGPVTPANKELHDDAKERARWDALE